MKIKNKLILVIISVAIVTLSFGFWGINNIYKKSIINKEKVKIEEITKLVSLNIDYYIDSMVQNVITLANSPMIIEKINESNAKYNDISDQDRNALLNVLNEKWKNERELNTKFIMPFMDNDLSIYLNKQKNLAKNYYGEIFITNEYGLAIGLTNKLSTIAHSYKYWWKGCYNNGKPQIFLDDRGFDTSVNGYVIGVVVPIYDNGKFIGLLKANINIKDTLLKAINSYCKIYNTIDISVVRSKGLIVAKKNLVQLSESINDKYLEYLKYEKNTNLENSILYISISPIKNTFTREGLNFGGSKYSIDHLAGNKNENWYVFTTVQKSEILSILNDLNNKYLFINFLSIVIMIISSTYIVNKIFYPLKLLKGGVNRIGQGDFEYKIIVKSKDEIGHLAGSFNEIAKKLNETTTSKIELEKEINKRVLVEKKLYELSTIDELTNIYNRRAFNDYIRKSLSRVKRYSEDICVLMLDIDNFKYINDNFGHGVGDDILIAFSNLLVKLVREADVVARWGGDEFIMILSNTAINDGLLFANRLKKELSLTTFPISNKITISAGITQIIRTDELDLLFTRADKALYNSKILGKDQINYK